jgi:hypothetical protein
MRRPNGDDVMESKMLALRWVLRVSEAIDTPMFYRDGSIAGLDTGKAAL